MTCGCFWRKAFTSASVVLAQSSEQAAYFSGSAALLACLAWHCWRSLHCWPVWCIQLALSAARLGAAVNREPRYTMSRFSTICMVSSESWKRLHSNLYAHDCTQFHFGNICSDVEMLHIIIGQLSEIRGTVPTTRQLYIMPPWCVMLLPSCLLRWRLLDFSAKWKHNFYQKID